MQKNWAIWNPQAILDYIEEFHDINIEINPEFLNSLSHYVNLITTLNFEELKNKYPEIPKILKQLQRNSFLCLDQSITDCLAESYLSFLMTESDEATNWAANQIISVNSCYNPKPSDKLPNSDIVLDQISKYPKEFFASASKESLKVISKGQIQEELVPYLLEEMETRGLEIPDQLFYTNNLNPSNLSPQLFVKYFLRFVDNPTIQISSLVFQGFLHRPTLHLLCIKEAIKSYKAKVLRAFEMIGKQMISNIPFPFNLSILYHPSVSSFISEVEFCDFNPENVNTQELNDILNGISYDYIYFVIPLLLELPAWLEKIQTICPPCYERINQIITYMFSENSNL